MDSLPSSQPVAFLQAVSSFPDKAFIHFEGQTFSYQDIYEQVCYVAASLSAFGLKKGDRVALYLENSPSFISAYLGVLWLGGVIVPVNTAIKSSSCGIC